MSWSLALTHGDFRVEGSHYGTVTRQKKLVQDIRCAILEKMGTDSLHPEYGSLIDGGRTPDGLEHAGVIGESDLDLAILEIETDLTRIARSHQQQQLARAKQDRFVYGRATLDPEEVLLELAGIDFFQQQDKLRVTIRITTANDNDFELTLPIDIPLT